MPEIKLKDLDQWIRAAGVVLFGDSIGLEDRRLVNDDFNEAFDPAQWSSGLNGNGSVIAEIPLKRAYCFSSAAADAAMLIDDNIFDPAAEWAIEVFMSGSPQGATVDQFALFFDSSTPAPMTNAAFTAGRGIGIFGNLITYQDTSDSLWSWTGTLWVNSAVALSYHIGIMALISYDDSGTMKWKIMAWDTQGNLQDETDGVPWASLNIKGANDWYGFMGTPRIDVPQASVAVMHYNRYGEPNRFKYLNTSQVSTMGQIIVGREITTLPISGVGLLGLDYDIGAGFTSGKTLAEAKADLIGTTPATLNLQAVHNSDGFEQASFEYNGQIITGTNGAAASPLFGGGIISA